MTIFDGCCILYIIILIYQETAPTTYPILTDRFLCQQKFITATHFESVGASVAFYQAFHLLFCDVHQTTPASDDLRYDVDGPGHVFHSDAEFVPVSIIGDDPYTTHHVSLWKCQIQNLFTTIPLTKSLFILYCLILQCYFTNFLTLF